MPKPSAAQALAPLVHAVLGEPLPVEVRFWDGSALGPADGPATIVLRTPIALRRILWAPNEVGFARAFITGDAEIEGDLLEAIRAVFQAAPEDLLIGTRTMARTLAAAARLGVIGPPPPRPAEEARLRGGRHSKARDAAAIAHHYDVGNDFYRLVLGPSLTYSCARFVETGMSLEDAQAAKHELVCAKLGLGQRNGMRLLDVGCGWGSMALHAAQHHGAAVVGVTISDAQATLARRRVAEAGLADRVEIRVQDYRDLGDETFDAISSIGMFEHVGTRNASQYFDLLGARLRPGGRLLNHAISVPGGFKPGRRSFAHRYVFPDGELADVGEVALGMARAGFEVRDVESLREHYAITLRHWVANLERHWEDAVAAVGVARARVWLLYMAGSAVNFDSGELSVHQVLGVVPDAKGRSGFPPTRNAWP